MGMTSCGNLWFWLAYHFMFLLISVSFICNSFTCGNSGFTLERFRCVLWKLKRSQALFSLPWGLRSPPLPDPTSPPPPPPKKRFNNLRCGYLLVASGTKFSILGLLLIDFSPQRSYRALSRL